jgi:hypothetical protein
MQLGIPQRPFILLITLLKYANDKPFTYGAKQIFECAQYRQEKTMSIWAGTAKSWFTLNSVTTRSLRRKSFSEKVETFFLGK